MISLPLIALALAAFGIGTTEFVIMGLLPEVATDLSVSVPTAGLLITGYALGVAIGAPIMALLTSKLQRRKALLILMGIFILGNLLCALSTGYGLLMAARVVTALCHGAFFGIGSVEAASLAPPNRKASAIAMMFTGLTLANVLGVPFGTLLGQEAGWRMTFFAVSAIGVLAFIALFRFLPKRTEDHDVSIVAELAALRNGRIWLALSITVLFSAAVFTLFTYIAPILQQVTGLTPRGTSYTLLLIGVGLTLGNVVGGRLADWKLVPTIFGVFALLILLQMLFHWTSRDLVGAEITLFLWGGVFFAGCSAVHYNALKTGADAPNLTSTLSIGAFNTGNALGAWAGSMTIDAGFALRTVPIVASLFVGAAMVMAAIFVLASRRQALRA